MRVYEDSNMIRFASNDGAMQYFSQPKGDISVAIVGNTKFQFFSKSRNKYITEPLDYNDVLNGSGAVYGANFNAVFLALNAFLNSFFFDITSDDVTNESTVIGATVTDALNTLQTSINALSAPIEVSVNTSGISLVPVYQTNLGDFDGLNVFGQVMGKEIAQNRFYYGTFVGGGYRNGASGSSLLGTPQLLIIENFAPNPIISQTVDPISNDYTLFVSSNQAGRNMVWWFRIFVLKKTLS